MNYLRPVTSKIGSVIKKTSSYSAGLGLHSPELQRPKEHVPCNSQAAMLVSWQRGKELARSKFKPLLFHIFKYGIWVQRSSLAQ